MDGQFVISLDYEKFWGVFDSLASKNYDENLNNVDVVIDKLLELSKTNNIKLTFATVGFLFNKTKQDFIKNTPKLLPSYSDALHNPYPLIDLIEDNEDIQHFGYKSLEKIKNDGNHEISTHTYCHYYCLENGQQLEQFEADLEMAIQVAKDIDVDIKSIVFPRNQVSDAYLEICKKHGILSYRGVENHAIYKAKPKKNSKSKTHRALRLSDAYFNITGNHTYKLDNLRKNGLINIASSYFLRPYSKKLSFLESFRINRIKKGMTLAAKNKELYHLWWHPHNFGNHMEENFKILDQIYNHYNFLNAKYGFTSVTMTDLAMKLIKKED